MFAEKRTVAGPFYLMQGEDGKDSIYLFTDRDSGSIGGAVYQIGWNDKYIIFTETSSPDHWTVIKVADRTTIKLPEAQRKTDPGFRDLPLLSPARAWANEHSHWK